MNQEERLAERILCAIEKEATVHLLLERLPSLFDPSWPRRAHDVWLELFPCIMRSVLTNVIRSQFLKQRFHKEVDEILKCEPKLVTVEGTMNGQSDCPVLVLALAMNIKDKLKSIEWLCQQINEPESPLLQALPSMECLKTVLPVRLVIIGVIYNVYHNSTLYMIWKCGRLKYPGLFI